MILRKIWYILSRIESKGLNSRSITVTRSRFWSFVVKQVQMNRVLYSKYYVLYIYVLKIYVQWYVSKLSRIFAQKLLTTRQSRFQVQAVYFTFPIRIEISRIRIFQVFLVFERKKLKFAGSWTFKFRTFKIGINSSHLNLEMEAQLDL